VTLPDATGATWDLTTLLASASPADLEITLTVAEGGRTDTATVRIAIASVPVPAVSMLDLQPKYSATKRIVLEGDATPVDAAHAELEWSWTGSIISGSTLTVLDLVPISSTPLTNQILVMAPNALAVGTSYRFRLEASDGRGTGAAEVDVTVNTPPSSGSVSISPSSGMAISTEFTITASSWVDDDIPLTYAFSTQPAGSTTRAGLSAASTAPAVSAVLPAGSLTVFATVTDAYEASADSTTTVTVNAYSPAPGSNMATDAGEMLREGITNANPQKTTQLVSAFAGALADQSSAAGGSATMTAADLAAAKETRELLANSLSTIADGAADAPSGQLTMMAEAAMAVTADPVQVTPAALQKSVAAIGAMSSARAMDGAATPPKGGSCTTEQKCNPKVPDRCTMHHICTDSNGARVAARVEPVSDDLVKGLVSAASNAHGANTAEAGGGWRRLAEAEDGDAAAKAAAAKALRMLAYKSSVAMGRGAMKGEYMKQAESELLVVSSKLDDATELEKQAVKVASNTRVRPPPGAISRAQRAKSAAAGRRLQSDGEATGRRSPGVAMQATAWTEGSSPFPTKQAPAAPRSPSRRGAAGRRLQSDGDGTQENVNVTTNTTVMSTGVLSLEYSVDGEELELESLAEPFVLELDLAESTWICGALGNFVTCEGSCVPTGGCDDRAHQFCSFYDVELEEWVIDPDAPPGNITADGRRIVCEFKHLTDVASFMGPKPSAMFNEPCFSCLDEFLKNPAGIIVVATCLFFLLCTMASSFYRYYRYSHKDWDEIAATKFAVDRKLVLSPDQDHPTTLKHALSHRLRHD
jgi:hypothetical protein